MPRRGIAPLPATLLTAVPALALGTLGLAVVATAAGHATGAGTGAPARFAVRQLASLVFGAALGFAAARAGLRRLLDAAPVLFVIALVGTAAVFLPGIGVRASGASRWLRIGPLTGNPAPFLIGATGLLIAASLAVPRGRGLARPPVAVGATLIAVALMAIEPDFSSAAVALAVAAAAFLGGGVAFRRVVPPALLAFALLALGASRFGYVGARWRGFLTPEQDRLGRGFEVRQLARINAAASPHGVGLGHGSARRHLHAPASDYVYAVVREELGRPGALGVIAAWLALAVGAALVARAIRGEPGGRAAALAAATALVAPAALHVAVCKGWLPIIGVSMPFLSYDPAATIASGAEIGLLAACALAAPAADQRTHSHSP